jgi:hypothetical protein
MSLVKENPALNSSNLRSAGCVPNGGGMRLLAAVALKCVHWVNWASVFAYDVCVLVHIVSTFQAER